MRAVDELIVPTSYSAYGEDAAMALFAFYLHAGRVEVLPAEVALLRTTPTSPPLDYSGSARSSGTF
jgi:hypothetical protein